MPLSPVAGVEAGLGLSGLEINYALALELKVPAFALPVVCIERGPRNEGALPGSANGTLVPQLGRRRKVSELLNVSNSHNKGYIE